MRDSGFVKAGKEEAFKDDIEAIFGRFYWEPDKDEKAYVRKAAGDMLATQGYAYGILRNEAAASVSVDYIVAAFEALAGEKGRPGVTGGTGRMDFSEDMGRDILKAVDEYGGIMHEKLGAIA